MFASIYKSFEQQNIYSIARNQGKKGLSVSYCDLKHAVLLDLNILGRLCRLRRDDYIACCPS